MQPATPKHSKIHRQRNTTPLVHKAHVFGIKINQIQNNALTFLIGNVKKTRTKALRIPYGLFTENPLVKKNELDLFYQRVFN